MGLLSRDEIFKVNDAAHEDVPVPEWGGTVRVKALNGKERMTYEGSLWEQRSKGRPKLRTDFANATLVQMTVVDEDGKLLFSRHDIELLSTKSAAALDRVVEVARRLAGLSDEDIEEAVGDFDEGPDGPSSTD